ncbi:hypothetical protein VTO73DRAFT_10509 [Trametes versicolor]
MSVISKLRKLPPGLSQPTTRTPVKRALVIGINYAPVDDDASEGGTLVCAHRDAREWRELLLNTYGYRTEEITLMLDATDVPLERQPTKKNILHQIYKLVDGLQSGDRVVFFYAGHSRQLESKSKTEDDGFDEALVPVDHSDNRGLIIDNDLRRMLVDPLPDGASLTAIFDSCHSGTLLDLDHYFCNAVYFPWLSKGKRRSKSQWQVVGRKPAQDDNKRCVKVTTLSPEAAAATNLAPSGAPHERANLRSYGRERVSKDKVLKFDTCIDELDSSEKGERRFILTRSSSMQVKRDGPLPGLKAAIQRCYSFDHSYRKLKKVGSWFVKALHERSPEPRGWFDDKARSESPEPMVGRRCDGWCEQDSTPKVHVVSIAACGDPQQTYESRKGKSMTRNLVGLLTNNPYPPCRNLVRELGFCLHKTVMQVHGISRKQIKKRKRGDDIPNVLDGVNFSEPQIGSQHTLTDDYRLIM